MDCLDIFNHHVEFKWGFLPKVSSLKSLEIVLSHVFCMSFEEAIRTFLTSGGVWTTKRIFLTSGRSKNDSCYNLSSSATPQKNHNRFRNISSLPCLLLILQGSWEDIPDFWEEPWLYLTSTIILVKSIECITPKARPPTDFEIILLFHLFCMSPKEA